MFFLRDKLSLFSLSIILIVSLISNVNSQQKSRTIQHHRIIHHVVENHPGVNYLIRDGPYKCKLYQAFCEFEFSLNQSFDFTGYEIDSNREKVCLFEWLETDQNYDYKLAKNYEVHKIRIVPVMVF